MMLFPFLVKNSRGSLLTVTSVRTTNPQICTIGHSCSNYSLKKVNIAIISSVILPSNVVVTSISPREVFILLLKVDTYNQKVILSKSFLFFPLFRRTLLVPMMYHLCKKDFWGKQAKRNRVNTPSNKEKSKTEWL